jgi:hypothetical protein
VAHAGLERVPEQGEDLVRVRRRPEAFDLRGEIAPDDLAGAERLARGRVRLTDAQVRVDDVDAERAASRRPSTCRWLDWARSRAALSRCPLWRSVESASTRSVVSMTAQNTPATSPDSSRIGLYVNVK